MKNMKIRRKFIVILAVVLFGFTTISVMSVIGLKTVAQQTADFKAEAYTETEVAWMARRDIRLLEFSLYQMVTTGDANRKATYKAQADTSSASFVDCLNKLASVMTDTKNVDAALELSVIAKPLADKFMAAAMGTDMTVPVVIMDNELLPVFDKIITEIAAIGDIAAADAERFVMEANSKAARISAVLAVIEIGCLAAAIILVLRVSASISKPLAEIEAAAKKMSEGILTTNISYVSEDEVGSVAESLRRSMAMVHSYIVDIGHAMGEMADGNFNVQPSQPFYGEFTQIEQSIFKFIVSMSKAISQIATTAEQVSAGSEHVSAGAQNLAQGATEQASGIEELSAAITDITGKVEQNAKNADRADEMANGATAALTSSNAHMQELMDAMNDINAKSVEISKIIKTIEDIAFQTNILALNAAVEAARAGQAGKGFAVVADEVRNLASKSSVAAKDTTELIESSVQSIGVGVGIAETTAKELSVIVGSAVSISELVDNIARATNAQSHSLGQITIGMEQISSVVQTNSATSEESAAAAEELSGQADILKSILEEFRIMENIPR